MSPVRPPKACTYPGCPYYCEPNTDYCTTHRKKTRANRRKHGGFPQSDKWRGSARFLKEREVFLRHNPICNICKIAPATVLDHVIAHKGNYDLFWDQTNWQGLCDDCHRGKHAWGRS